MRLRPWISGRKTGPDPLVATMRKATSAQQRFFIQKQLQKYNIWDLVILQLPFGVVVVWGAVVVSGWGSGGWVEAENEICKKPLLNEFGYLQTSCVMPYHTGLFLLASYTPCKLLPWERVVWHSILQLLHRKLQCHPHICMHSFLLCPDQVLSIDRKGSHSFYQKIHLDIGKLPRHKCHHFYI